jgi:hypothetical protein
LGALKFPGIWHRFGRAPVCTAPRTLPCKFAQPPGPPPLVDCPRGFLFRSASCRTVAVPFVFQTPLATCPSMDGARLLWSGPRRLGEFPADCRTCPDRTSGFGWVSGTRRGVDQRDSSRLRHDSPWTDTGSSRVDDTQLRFDSSGDHPTPISSDAVDPWSSFHNRLPAGGLDLLDSELAVRRVAGTP